MDHLLSRVGGTLGTEGNAVNELLAGSGPGAAQFIPFQWCSVVCTSQRIPVTRWPAIVIV